MRITFVTSKIDLETSGGSVPDLDRKLRDMQEKGAQVSVVTLISERNKLPSDLPYSVLEEYTPNKSLPFLQWRHFQILRKYEKRTDVFHTEGQYSYGAALYRLLGGKPVVIFYNRETFSWERGTTVRRILRHYIERFLNYTLAPQIDHFIFTTPLLAARYRMFGIRIPDSKVTVEPDYIDQQKILRKIGKERAEPKSAEPTTPVTIFASGRMIPEKGFRVIVEALALLSPQTRDTLSVTLSGDGPEREKLMALAKEKGLSKIVTFPGWVLREELLTRLNVSDIFIFPLFFRELTSVMLMEAMTLGLPVIIPRGGGFEWLAGEGGTLFEENNPESLARAIEKLARSSEERARKSKAVLERMRELDHHRLAENLYTILSKVSKSRP